MTIFYGSDIWKWIALSAAQSHSRIWLASAYVKSNQFAKLCRCIENGPAEKILIVRWQLNDLLCGASDLAVYELSQKYGWRVLINLNLHAKTYLFDNNCAVGSANLTTNGMRGVSPPGNMEMLSQANDIESVSIWFDKLIGCSKELDDSLYQQISAAVDAHADALINDTRVIEYENWLLGKLTLKDEWTLFTKDFYWTSGDELTHFLESGGKYSSDLKHDLEMLGTSDREAIQASFLESPVFCWLLSVVTSEMYFGQLSQKLHSALQDDSRPYRKDVKKLLSNLLSWTSLYGEDFFHIDQPNFSQRITRINCN